MFLLRACIRINCTVVELKHDTDDTMKRMGAVLIVPLWN